MKKIIVCFICVSLIVLLCSCNTTSMYADNDVGEYVEAKDGYLIQASIVDMTQSIMPIDLAQLTVRCGKDIVDISCNLKYYDTIFGAYFVNEFRYYIIKVDGVVYVIEYITVFADNELYFKGYSVQWDKDGNSISLVGTIWTELNNYCAIDNMPRILEYFFLAPAPEINETGFSFNVDYTQVEISLESCSMVYQILQLWDNCIAEVKVSNIGSTFVSTASMPNEVRDFTNMVGEVVSIEGPAYN